MSTATLQPDPPIASVGADSFDASDQKSASGTLGMWLFLCTALLIFGGLFCAYGAYRYNYPRVFAYARQYMDLKLGGIAAVLLIASSFTMAWGMRCAQLGQRAGLIFCLVLTLVGGSASLRVRWMEYCGKLEHHLGMGAANRYHKDYAGDPTADEPQESAEAPLAGDDAEVRRQGPADLDPLVGTLDEPKIKPSFNSAVGLLPPGVALEPAGRHLAYKDLDKAERRRISTFFSLYFLMTGLHALFVLVGLGWIAGALLIAICRKSATAWAAPASSAGLYFELIALIWFFIFPLLYLIH